jgi:tRNA(Ile)-lysidine synthase
MLSPEKQTLRKVRETISRYEMIRQGQAVVVAVSGGPDSVCLLDILHELSDELKISLIVSHYDHGLRPAEDESETVFVRELARDLHLPFMTGKAPPSLRGKSASIEERARNARYRFLEKVRVKHGAQRIALGHNLNDQAETVIMRLLRGSGPSGLTGIPPRRDSTIIRPLIEVERLEIETYLKARRLNYVTDSSNLKTDYLRNKIRLELMPLLEQHQPRFVHLLGQTADILREEDAYLERIGEAWLSREAELEPDNAFQIPISSFLKLPAALRRRVVRQIIGKVKRDLRRITWDHVESILRLAHSEKPQASIHLPGKLNVKRSYDHLIVSAGQGRKSRPFSHTIHAPGVYRIKEIGRTISVGELKNRKDMDFRVSPYIAFLDADKVQYPLKVRSFKPGDRFVPFGMTGHKKLKDFFVDLKVPMEQRRSTPVLCCGDTIVWVCGLRIDDRFKVTANTKRVMKVVVQPSLMITDEASLQKQVTGP